MPLRKFTIVVTLITLICCLSIPATHTARVGLSRRHAPQFLSYSVLENNARTKVTIISGDGKTSFSIETDNSAPDRIPYEVPVIHASPGIFDKIPRFNCEGSACLEGNRVPFDWSKDTALSRSKKSCPTGFRLSSSNRFCSKCSPHPLESCPSSCTASSNRCICCISQPL